MTDRPLRFAQADSREDFQTRIAWYYYVGNMTQQEIADLLGTSRNRVNRELSACRENGIIRISITRPVGACVAAEEALKDQFGLDNAIVVPTPRRPEDLRAAIGFGAAGYLEPRIHDGMKIGVGWGRTTRSIVHSLTPRPLRNIQIISVLGGLSHCSRINTFEIVSDFADLFDADRHFFAAPIYASTEEARDVLLAQDAIRETHELAKTVDIAIVTTGDLSDSLIIEYGMTPKEVVELDRAGAVGDVLGQFVDSRGQLVDHPINRRAVALAINDLKAIPSVMLASGGASKIRVMRALLGAGLINVLATDEATAEALLAAETTGR
ncbi:sugar-binding transcriptional regulator [Fodinicurvata sp. EGI_FJ10296]|uniref:sugar-binding transcriptional regulator n=1 Tax=Fodinicurvata sp. EGI_FJ10296 TaxID=3231908 RepID=UPI0034559403